MSRTRARAAVITALLGVVAVVLAGCSGPGQDPGGSGDPRTIRVALDWTPNTNHTGLYVAQQLGWFSGAGLNVEILPYNQTSPDTLVANGAADFGISFQSSFTYSKATGADITSVMAVLQHWATEIAVRADRQDIRTPRDLDGKTYAGFGEPGEVPKMAAVIRNAGGRGEFETVQLGTSAYEALYAGQADFTEPFVAWEGIEARLRGEPLRSFRYTDYGFPDAYNVILIGNSTWLRDHPDEATRFVRAAQRGYQLAADDPAQGARLLTEANPGAFTDPRLVDLSSRMLAERYLTDERGRVGTQTLQRWAGYSGLAYDSGTVVGPDGKPVTRKPDFRTWFTNAYLAPAG